MTPPQLSPDQQAAQARTRFFIMSTMRLLGVVLIMFGMAAMVDKVPFLPDDLGRYAGFLFAVVGAINFTLVPRLLARAWATPRDPE